MFEMDDINSEITTSLDNLKAWLSSRPSPSVTGQSIIDPPEDLRPLGFSPLILERACPYHLDNVEIVNDSPPPKGKTWTDLSHLVAWSRQLATVLKNNQSNLAALELLQGLNEYPVSLARFHVDEAIGVVESALSFELGIDTQHPDTKEGYYATTTVIVEANTGLLDIIRQVFTCLFSKAAVRLVVEGNNFYSAATAVYLVDLMHQAGATVNEVLCLAVESRDNIDEYKLMQSIGSNKSSKLSVVATVFKQTDTFAAAQGIIESYFREQYPNLAVLVEESVYERFVKDWQRYYSHAVHIGPRLDKRTTVVDSFNSQIQIDLEAIDVKCSAKMSGNVINVLKFRTLTELLSLLGKLSQIPYMSVWNDDVLLAREFCFRIDRCNEFWINHVPKNLAGSKFSEDLLSFYSTVIGQIDGVNESTQVPDVYFRVRAEASQLWELRKAFMRKDSFTRKRFIAEAFISTVKKNKTLKKNAPVNATVANLMSFARQTQISVSRPGGSRVETMIEPVGLAILIVKSKFQIKAKRVLIELIFKNLLLGNAVLLVCPSDAGLDFAFENDHLIPFKMNSFGQSYASWFECTPEPCLRDGCASQTFAIEVEPSMNSDACNALTMAVGTRRKSIWYPDGDQINYWLNEMGI